MTKIRLDTDDLKEVLMIRRQYKLDFGDAYQYIATQKYGYVLISFDADFDRTEKGRNTPKEVLS